MLLWVSWGQQILVLFDFGKIEDTGKLLRYRQVMLWIVRLCTFAGVSMVSGLALGLAFGFHTVEVIIIGVFCCICLGLMIPCLFCFAWIDEIERELTRRHISIDCPINKRIGSWALKMMIWAALIILLPILISKLTG